MLFDDNVGFVTLDFFNNNMTNDNFNKIINKNNDCGLTNLKTGLARGNMFEDEYVLYDDYKPEKIVANSKQDELMLEIMELSFAILDLNLYLDIHPDDKEMLQKFQEYVEKSCQKEMEYVAMYGPLEVIDSDSASTFTWINDPWPWEDTGGSKYV